jgi:hypothetical protein
MPAELGVIAFSVAFAIAMVGVWARVQRSVTNPVVVALAYTGLSIASAFVVGSVGGGLDIDVWAIFVSVAVVLATLVVAFLVGGLRINAAVQARRREGADGPG